MAIPDPRRLFYLSTCSSRSPILCPPQPSPSELAPHCPTLLDTSGHLSESPSVSGQPQWGQHRKWTLPRPATKVKDSDHISYPSLLHHPAPSPGQAFSLKINHHHLWTHKSFCNFIFLQGNTAQEGKQSTDAQHLFQAFAQSLTNCMTLCELSDLS
ncbi:rCG48944 [Rattus norvegicus]|uniref:RCG48944 n=1 Tax=Rattus norvegicus TaxID=10116 RepID=A6IFK8_RAT|nr:rCG48944 [Rattus norvegicus]